jgi:hypothetical protein
MVVNIAINTVVSNNFRKVDQRELGRSVMPWLRVYASFAHFPIV